LTALASTPANPRSVIVVTIQLAATGAGSPRMTSATSCSVIAAIVFVLCGVFNSAAEKDVTC
jgi:hypothetical protein